VLPNEDLVANSIKQRADQLPPTEPRFRASVMDLRVAKFDALQHCNWGSQRFWEHRFQHRDRYAEASALLFVGGKAVGDNPFTIKFDISGEICLAN
jgi:hypothetical protein